MKKNEIEELRRKSLDELKKIVTADREKLRQLKFDLAAGKVKNVREIRKIKRRIAQALTVLREKSIGLVNQKK